MSIYYILKELTKSKEAEITINVGKNHNLSSSILYDDNLIIDLIWSYKDIYKFLQKTINNYGWLLSSHKKEQIYKIHNITYYLTNDCFATVIEEFVDWSLSWKSDKIIFGACPIRKKSIPKSNIKIKEGMTMRIQEKWTFCCNKSIDLNIIKMHEYEYHIDLIIQRKHEILDLVSVLEKLMYLLQPNQAELENLTSQT